MFFARKWHGPRRAQTSGSGGGYHHGNVRWPGRPTCDELSVIKNCHVFVKIAHWWLAATEFNLLKVPRTRSSTDTEDPAQGMPHRVSFFTNVKSVNKKWKNGSQHILVEKCLLFEEMACRAHRRQFLQVFPLKMQKNQGVKKLKKVIWAENQYKKAP